VLDGAMRARLATELNYQSALERPWAQLKRRLANLEPVFPV
jgi:hypothetical protein